MYCTREGELLEICGGGVLPSPLNPGIHPFSDQNIRFSIPNFRPDPYKFPSFQDKMAKHLHVSYFRQAGKVYPICQFETKMFKL